MGNARSSHNRRESVANLVKIVSSKHRLEKEFLEACFKGNLDDVRRILHADRSLIDTSYFKKRHGDMILVAPVPIALTDRSTCLHIAVLTGNTALLRILLQSAAEYEQRLRKKLGFRLRSLAMRSTQTFKWNVLHFAAHSGRADCLKILLDAVHFKKSDLAVRCISQTGGWTPLMLAALEGHSECVEELAKRGVALDDSNEQGMTALHLAAQHGHATVVRDICARCGKSSYLFEIKEKEHGWTPLMFASFHAYGECVEEIVARGNIGVVDERDFDGKTALGLAGKGKNVTHYKDVDRTIKALEKYHAAK